MENTDFVIEHIDEEVQVIADQPSVVTNYPANTDFFIENIDSNVISIAHSLNIEASEVDFRPANTDFFIENIDKNVIAIAESMNLSPSEVDFRPANTAFFVENIDKNLIEIAESLSLTPYEVTIRPANTDMFIENIDKNVTLIKGSTNVVTVSGEYININLPDGGKVQSAQLTGNATQQTYSGKNLLNTNALNRILPYTTTSNGITFKLESDGSITLNGTNNGSGNSTFTIYNSANPFVLSGGSYTGDLNPTDGVYRAVSLIVYDGAHYRGFTQSSTQTLDASNAQAYLQVANGNTTNFSNYKIYPMLESGTTKSSYEPYVGGTPAPNPEFPMPISVLTGNNTVKIDASDDSQEFSIDLGSLELAKIGTYQDRIYKDGEKWYVEKQVGKVVLDGSEYYTTTASQNTGNTFYTETGAIDTTVGSSPVLLSNYFTWINNLWGGDNEGAQIFYLQGTHKLRFRILKTALASADVAGWQAWLSTHPTTVYYALATPITTEITEQALIDQLEALASATLGHGANNIFTEIATGNAMPTLELVIEKY